MEKMSTIRMNYGASPTDLFYMVTNIPMTAAVMIAAVAHPK